MNGKTFINSICGRCAHVDVCDSYKDNRLKCGCFLEERPHGEWDFIGNNLFKCTHCGYIADADYLRKWRVYTFEPEFPTACLKCGADMSDKKDDLAEIIEVAKSMKDSGEEKKSCLNCGTSECELGNRARYGFCGNWTMREGDTE